ncbi:MAG TPA: SH3 domain-containing protein [Blastocatellia bacterium]|nr:SH3 domain-containing protein [Blastocatellia bacterium]
MATTGNVTASLLNLRSSPNGPVIGQLPKNTTVNILEDDGEWLKVTAQGQIGFVSAEFVTRQTDSTPAEPAPPPAAPPGAFRFEGNMAVAPDGTQFAKKFKLGVFNTGKTSINQFVKTNTELFANVPSSLLRVMQAVSKNEGNLEAINTWDNAFVTFGVFQWTVGTGSGAGELAALLNRLKTASAEAFQEHFGQHGLDIQVPAAQPGITPTGFLILNGVTLSTAEQKEQLRTLEWAYRFWTAGADDAVRQAQVEHAMSRVDLFYRDDRHKIGNRFIGDYVTSEYGVALILDQHVNRPGNVPGTIAKAVAQFVGQLGKDEPANWGDAEEAQLLKTYIQFRAETSMTDSTLRANNIRQAVTAGLASDKRGSYQG